MHTEAKSLRRWLFFAGAFNISLALPLAIPGSLAPYLEALSWLNARLALGGQPLAIPAPGAPRLLANTAGIDLVLIGVLVLHAGLAPERRTFIVLANAIGRLVFAFVVTYYVITTDLARLVLVIAGIDVGLGLVFLWHLARSRSS